MALPTHLTETDEATYLPRAEFVAACRGRPVQLSVVHERDFHGSLANATSYMAVCAFFTIAVFEWLWQTRYLIAASFFMFIATMAFTDVLSARRIRFYRVDTTDDGPPISFATPSRELANAVLVEARAGQPAGDTRPMAPSTLSPSLRAA